MPNRRAFLLICCGSLLSLLTRQTLAQTAGDRAVAFVRLTGEQILNGMQSAGSVEDRRKIVGSVIDRAIDVDGLAKFCLGRYWQTASADQQQRYTRLFHEVLIGNITSKLGEYQEVKLTVGRSQPQGDAEVVTSTIERANNPPTTVQWVVGNIANEPKVIDLIAESTSLRVTQRSDYASFLAHNNSDVEALIKAMRAQLVQN